ncbi:MAG: hypothetical protein IJZ34_12125 [Lachnospiraceae bacterium]|nr:hypothetical protein [Lachnospiraceae bacterium]
MKPKMYVNVIHRVGADDTEPFMKQQQICHKNNIKTTILLRPEGFNSDDTIRLIKQEHDMYGDEIALSLHAVDVQTKKSYGIREGKIWLIDFEIRKQIIVKYFEKFFEVFGYYPKAVAAYILDARTLNFIHENYPCVKAAITNCFEEGIKMFAGNQNMWHLFSDGGPWGAYYPSKKNSLIPAANKEEYCGIVGLPHLNRDMLMTITSRDDLFSGHVANVVRAKAYDLETGECPYTFDFIDMWLEQLHYNSFGYYNIFVSPIWMTDNTMLDEPGSLSIKLYDENMEYLKKKISEDRVSIMTMSEFGEWYTENIEIGTPEVNNWRDIICGTDRQMYWYIDPMMRVCFDGNIGGAICDLRPYAGRINKDTGPDTPNLYDMNQPYIISAEMRGGVHGGSLHTLKIYINKKEYCVALKRTSFIAEGNAKINITPVTVKSDGIKVTFESVIEFDGMGGMLITRRLLDVSDENAEVTFEEYDRTCFGTTQYQGDLRGCKLRIKDAEDTEELEYRYGGKELYKADAKVLEAVYPQIGTAIEMSILSDDVNGKAEEGFLFSPFITLSAKRIMKKGEELRTCLRIKRAD